ncbi:hypothetical protein HZH66_006042 [Vespula vulgaris]|uniref:Uncharacterized protein n=1 Tax=Vespula vulgaris TaxID=7454 RepID=A0A834K693_VESVU|nr:hypothetical protein HZH66_006042 [Vespula vulgaris]
MKIYFHASAAKATIPTPTPTAMVREAIATAALASSIRARKSGRISKKVGFVETKLKEDEDEDEEEEEEKMEGKRRPEESRNYPREKPNVHACRVLGYVGLCCRFLSRFKLQPGRWLAPQPSGPFVSDSSSSFPKERDTPVSESSLEGLKIKDTKRWTSLLASVYDGLVTIFLRAPGPRLPPDGSDSPPR